MNEKKKHKNWIKHKHWRTLFMFQCARVEIYEWPDELILKVKKNKNKWMRKSMQCSRHKPDEMTIETADFFSLSLKITQLFEQFATHVSMSVAQTKRISILSF